MKILIKIIISISLFLTFNACEVTFDKELREYIDNIVGRSPLDFSLSGSEIIDDYDSINMGYSVADSNADYTITNNENIDIKLAAFEGVSGDFTIAAFEAFTLSKGESYTFDIAFDLTDTNFGKRVFKEVKFGDTGGREYTFYLWATSKSQPLAIYNTDGVGITEFDLGAWADTDNIDHTIILKNEGLDNLLINSISVPTGINLTGENSFSMAINEEREIHLEYDTSTGSVDAEDITFSTDDARESEFSLSLYAGGALSIDILDSGLSVLSGDLDFGEYVSGDPVSLTFYLDNTSLFDMDLEVSFNTFNDSDMFTIGLLDTLLTVDENVDFQASFLASGDAGNKTRYIQLKDVVSNRTLNINFTGLYSPTP